MGINNCKYYKISRHAWINSTAFGYEFARITKDDRGNVIGRIIRPIHTFSMNRFYKLSNGWADLRSDKSIDFSTLLRLTETNGND